MQHFDIIIVGGGMVGTALACALAQNTPLSIAVLEAQQPDNSWCQEQYHHRVSAIALSSIRFFQALKIWDEIKRHRVSPFTSIKVWDAEGQHGITFDCRDIAEPILGCIIENNLIQQVLMQKIAAYPQVSVISPVELVEFTDTPTGVELIAADGRQFSARVAVAADGARSWLREQVGIGVEKHDYEQQALVATIRSQLAHEKIARQCFLSDGPLAFLPLQDSHSTSIVWSLPVGKAYALLTLSDEQFCHELETITRLKHLSDRNEFSLGSLTLEGKRSSFPLHRQLATQYVKSHVVLVGDAAHMVHPLAGQGVNIGFLDVMALTETIITALEAQRNWASHSQLRRYERWRKAENMPMLIGIDCIKNLFATDAYALTQLRTFGLSLTQQFTWLRNIFTRQAVGRTSACESLF